MIYETCSSAHGTDSAGTLQCISNWIESDHAAASAAAASVGASATAAGSDTSSFVTKAQLTQWLLILTGAMVFFMQAGFAMVCAGAVRKKNVNNTMLKNLLDACGAALAFYMVGYGVAFGDDMADGNGDDAPSSTFMGGRNLFLTGDNVESANFFFQYAFSTTAATIVAGVLAERCQMAAYFCYSFYLVAFVYPIVVHAVCKFGKETPHTASLLDSTNVLHSFLPQGAARATSRPLIPLLS
jgi:Ammonium Transporter Family